MKILVIGGTMFVGKNFIEAALKRGHEITMFNRGKTKPNLFPAVEKLIGNRDGDLTALEGRKWDAVIDTCGYVPRVVKASVDLLAKATEHYTFISSISVYANFGEIGLNEDSAVATLKDETVEEITGETYGGLKVLCEKVVEEGMPGRSLIIRPGYIVGPDDHTDRFTYWVHRATKGGDMLAPNKPEQALQVIDVRDLAEWTLSMIEKRGLGAYNATGPEYPLTWGAFLQTVKDVSGSNANFIWVDQDFLAKHELRAGVELPIWATDTPEYAGFAKVNCSKAIGKGLTFRPIADTVRDLLAWDKARPQEDTFKNSLKMDKEAEVLREYQTQN
jgi:2'-hydroxyisoflavone reductase